MVFGILNYPLRRNGMRKIIVANWKMNGSLAFIQDFIPALKGPLTFSPNQTILCPPFPLLTALKDALEEIALEGNHVSLGAQNCHPFPQGAFTGEVSAPLLAEIGCLAVIVGHSERRTQANEDNALVKAKAASAHAAGLVAIVCIGESLAMRESGDAIQTVIQQLHESLPSSATADNTMIAYEPIWAIGTGLTAGPEEITLMHQALHGARSEPFPLLYGGSVTHENAGSILTLPHVDGVLVGGASLKAESFGKICKII
jgi:triosephosphate isomerase